jgi:hypothetical protein
MAKMRSLGIQPQHQAFNRAQRAQRAGNDGMKDLADAYTRKKSARAQNDGDADDNKKKK